MKPPNKLSVTSTPCDLHVIENNHLRAELGEPLLSATLTQEDHND